MSDGLGPDQGRRLFPFIALGGTLGAIAGAFVTERLARARLDPGLLLLVAILCLEGAVQVFRILSRRFGMGAGTGASREPGPGLLEGIRLFSRSPYLLLIGLYILLFTLTSTLLYLQQGRIVAAAFPSTAARTAAFARLDLWVNLLTLLAQALVAGRLIAKLGIRVVLCAMPLLTFAGFGALALAPSFAVLAVFQVLRRGLHYAVDRPARETLFIPLGPEEKYKAKPFIDTFIYRAGDLLGTWTPGLLAALSVPAGGLGIAVSGVWLGSAYALGRLTPPRPR
jgi:AAA family ATP:ADP antiporter